MEYCFIQLSNPYYKEAVKLRIELFFKETENPLQHINDYEEELSDHLICIHNHKVIGTGRLTLKEETGVISQMAIDKEYQNKGVGKQILGILINECKKKNIKKVTLSARLAVIPFYKKFKFEVYGNIYPSKKTRISHQNMELNL